jgi:hypothetical protein
VGDPSVTQDSAACGPHPGFDGVTDAVTAGTLRGQ